MYITFPAPLANIVVTDLGATPFAVLLILVKIGAVLVPMIDETSVTKACGAMTILLFVLTLSVRKVMLNVKALPFSVTVHLSLD